MQSNVPSRNISSLYCTKLYEKYSKICKFFVTSDREKLKKCEISVKLQSRSISNLYIFGKYSFFFHSISIGLIVLLLCYFFLTDFGTKIPKFVIWAQIPKILKIFLFYISIFHSLICFQRALNQYASINVC